MRCNVHDEGSMMKFLPILFSLVVAGILALYFVSFQKEASIRQKGDQLARQYLLQMETEGYLSNEAMNALEDNLKQCGIHSISFEGSTVNPVGYGKPIVLKVRGMLSIERYQIPDLFHAKQEKRIAGFYIRKETTAKN